MTDPAFAPEPADHVPGDPETTAFRRAARLHQSRWRARRGYPTGTHPTEGGPKARLLGSRLPLAFARESGANFLDPRVLAAVRARLASPEPGQTLAEPRLWADLLSSMPLCFNLFGTLGSPEVATTALRTWFPDVPGTVRALRFEWSPGRGDPAYLGNRSAFDAAFLLDLPDGGTGVLAVETKYHEAPAGTRVRPDALARYREVATRSGRFRADALDALAADDRSQLWLDHLLALSMLQHGSGAWRWVRFVLVHPGPSRAWARLADAYAAALVDDGSFVARTFESLLPALEPAVARALGERYVFWT